MARSVTTSVFVEQEKEKCLQITLRPALRQIEESEQKQNECSGDMLVEEEFQEANPYSKTTNSTKSCIGGKINTCTDLDENTYIDLVNIRGFSPSSQPDNNESIVNNDVDINEQSNWAVYKVFPDSSKTVHLARPVPISDFEEQGNEKCLQINDCPASRQIEESEQEQNECSGDMLVVEGFQEANPYSKTTKCGHKTNDHYLNDIVDCLETPACHLLRHTETYWFGMCDGKALRLTKSNVGVTIPTCTQLGERAYEQELNKGVLIEFHKYHPENKESKEHEDVDLKTQSHCAIYLGSGTIAGPNTPYCVSYHIIQGMSILKVVYQTKEQDNNTDLKLKDSDELKSLVRNDELFHVAKVENAEPYQDKQMDEINTPKAFYPTKEQDNNTDLKLKDSGELKTIMRIDEQFQVKNVQNAEICQTNQTDEMFNLSKSSVGGTVNTCTQLDVRTSEQELNKGDLIEFRPYHSLTSLYPPYSYPDNKESRVYKDVDGKAQSHWAIYLGSGTIAGPNTSCCVIVPKEIPTTDQRKIILIVVYPTKEKDSNTDRNLKDSGELKTIVRIDELFKIANVQNAEPYQDNQMDEINTPKAVHLTKEQDNNTDLKLKDSGELKTNVSIDEHVQVANVRNAEPYEDNQMDEINTPKAVYLTKKQDNKTDLMLKDSGELKAIVKIDELFKIANVQNAEPYQDNQMDEINTPKVVHLRKEQDNNTDLKLKDSGELKTNVSMDEHVQVANVQNAEPYQDNQMDEINTPKAVHLTKEQDNNADLMLKDSGELKTNVSMDEHVQVANVRNAEPYQDNQMDEINTPKAFYPTKEQDNNTDLKLKDSGELKTIMRIDEQFQVPSVQNAELCQTNQMDEMFNSQKSSVGITVNTCTQLDEKTYEEVFNKGDLIEFRPYHSLTIRYPPYSYPDNKECIAHKDVERKAQSHWAVYLGSGQIAHVAGANTPYCVNVLREVPTINQTKSILKVAYPTKEQDNNTDLILKDSDDLKPIVRIDDLYQVAKVQNAEPYENNQMDETYIAGTPDEIVNVAKYLVGKALPHDFITKDCKDFAVFCRYGENLRSLMEIKQPNQLMNKNTFMRILGVVIVFVALVLCTMF